MATRAGGSKASGAGKRASGKRTASKRASSSRTASAKRADKSVKAFREAVERSVGAIESNVVTVPRERLQEVVDDAVERGRMTRKDANELVSTLVSRGRKYRDELVRDLEKLFEQARKDLEARTAAARRELEARTARSRQQATRAAERVTRAARDAADRPLAQADRLRRRAGVAGEAPISAYETLTAAQVRARLKDLTKADLRKVRTLEKRGKARKGILGEIEKRLAR